MKLRCDVAVRLLDPGLDLQEHRQDWYLLKLALLLKLLHHVFGHLANFVINCRRDRLRCIVDRFSFEVLKFADCLLCSRLHFSFAILQILEFSFGLTLQIMELAFLLLNLLFVFLALLNQT